MERESKTKKRRLSGEVVSTKMQKTAVVKIQRIKLNARYQKRITLTTRLKAENPDNHFKEGDFVVIEETRPISKEKRWLIISKTKKII